ncbi:MAG: patatin-like phospholipase family protein [Pyrinomonadaceae bacterium]
MFRILSIDGGGVRGIIPALVLAEIERRTGKRVCELFDLIAGTSTGGILALGLTKPKTDGARVPQYAAKDLVKLYEEQGSRIFSSSLLHSIFALGNVLDNKYPSGPIEDVLAEYFGDTMLSQALTSVLIPSYEIELRSAFFFKSHKAAGRTLVKGEEQKDYDYPMRDVARATSAAPTYFEPGLIDKLDNVDDKEGSYALIDGGTYANNPAMCALAEAICTTRFHKRLDEVFMVSLGTGQQTRERPILYREAKGWGTLGWATSILSVVFDGVGDTVHFQTGLILRPGPRAGYHRLQVTLPEGKDRYKLDDTRPSTISELKDMAKSLIAERDGEIDDICRKLVPKPPRKAAAAGTRRVAAAAAKGRVAATKGRAAPAKGRAAAGTRARASKKAAR